MFSNFGIELKESTFGADRIEDKINQDCALVVPNIGGKEQIMFAVFDGHGPKGEWCSEYCAFTLTEMLEDKATEAKLSSGMLVEQFHELNKKLLKKRQSAKSGTTATVMLVDSDNNLIVGNIGDSRAVKGFIKPGPDSIWQAEVLTKDHMPEDPEEKARIEATGGYIFKEEEFGSARIFDVPDPLQAMRDVAFAASAADGAAGAGGGMLGFEEPGPGLAMSRVLGHHKAASVGIIDEPTMKEIKLDDSDKCLIVASDGLWDVIEPEQAVAVAKAKFPDAIGAAKTLVSQATSLWTKEVEDYRDDITVMVVYLPVAAEALKEKPKQDQETDGRMTTSGGEVITSSEGMGKGTDMPTGAEDIELTVTSSTSISAVPTDSASADAMAEASNSTRRVTATAAQRKRSVVTMFKVDV